LGLGKESVTQLDDTIIGYPEMNFFRSQMLKNITGSQYEKTFDGINFGSPGSKLNYVHLFYLPPAEFRGELPTTSLFNLDTLNMLFEKTKTIVNIFEDSTIEYEFSELAEFTAHLKLSDDRQTYLLLIWLKNMLEVTAMRKSEGGTYLTTNLMGLAGGSIKGAHNWMSKEFPSYLYGNIMAESNSNGCEKNINNYIRDIEPEQVGAFCNDTLLNLVSHESYSFYASLYFTKDYDKMQYIYDTTGLSEQSMQALVTPGYYLERTLMTAMKKVKKVYANDYCWRSVGQFCSNRELAYAQWHNNAISDNPPKPLNSSSNLVDLTGAKHYKPELKTYYDFAKTDIPPIDFNATWDLISSGKLYNGKFIGDVLLKAETKDETLKLFNTPVFLKYLKMLMIEEGMGGLFVRKTPKEYIEGYEDKIIKSTSMSTIEQGGDPTLSPLMSINDPPTTVVNGTDCFFVGDDLIELTRQYCLWHKERYITVPGNKITGIRSWTSENQYPWKVPVAVKGTDGGQFGPLMKSHDDLWLYSTDLMIPIKFNYKKGQKVNGMPGWRYEPDQILLKNSTEDDKNDVYFSGIHGTLNLTSVYGAPVFASKGHYLDIGYNEKMTSVIKDSSGEVIVAEHSDDEVYMVIEPWSGVALSAGLRLMLNFKIEKDFMFENMQGTFLIPYLFERKEYTMRKDQIKDNMGALKTALSVKTAIQVVGYLFGIILILGGIFLLYWSWRVKKNEGLNYYQVVEDNKPEDNVMMKKEPMLNSSDANEETKDQEVSH